MTTAVANNVPPKKALNIALWVVQALLALSFIMAGFMKTTSPIDVLHTKMLWTTWVPDGLVRFIGAAELLGGLGLILPAATRILPWLTGVAAAALCLVMVLGFGSHLMHSDAANAAPSVVMGLLAAFVAYGRLKAVPIKPRG